MSPRRSGNRCKTLGCVNTFTDTIGNPGLSGGPDCVPCHFAKLMVRIGRTPEEVESLPLLIEMNTALERFGWTWEQLKESYARESQKAASS